MITGIGLKANIAKEVVGQGITNPELLRYAERLPGLLLKSRSDNTVKKYETLFKKWDSFIKDRGGISLPANYVELSLFFVSLIDSNTSASYMSAYSYAIKWVHEINGFKDPTGHPFIANLLQTANRSGRRNINKKDPVTGEMIKDLFIRYRDSTDLLVVRDLCMILFGYMGFLRYDELSSLKCNDFVLTDSYVKIIIRCSKTDQYHFGNEVLLSKLESDTCPLFTFRKYASMSNLDLKSDFFAFRPIVRNASGCKLIHVNKKLSYTTTRERLVARLREVCGPGPNLGLHSLRAGGASAAANAGIRDRYFKRHGRWKSENAKDGYVADSLEARLSVSRSLGL